MKNEDLGSALAKKRPSFAKRYPPAEVSSANACREALVPSILIPTENQASIIFFWSSAYSGETVFRSSTGLPREETMNSLIRLFAAMLFVLGAQACSTTGGAPSGASALPADPMSTTSTSGTSAADDFVPAVVGIPTAPGPLRAYRIGPHDLLRIEVFQVGDLTTEKRVNEGGSILMPLIGNVKVGGLTPMEAEQAIAGRLEERYLDNPQVSVSVTESSSQRVTVTGQVKKPGVFPLVGETTLMQAIAMAGGLDEVAKKEEIIVFRKQERGGVNAYVVDLVSIEEGKLTDPVMITDDRVVVPKSGMAVFTRGVGNVLTGWAVRAPFF